MHRITITDGILHLKYSSLTLAMRYLIFIKKFPQSVVSLYYYCSNLLFAFLFYSGAHDVDAHSYDGQYFLAFAEDRNEETPLIESGIYTWMPDEKLFIVRFVLIVFALYI